MADSWEFITLADGQVSRESIQDGRGNLITRYLVGGEWKYTLWASGSPGPHTVGKKYHERGTYGSAKEAKEAKEAAGKKPDEAG